jgi:peptidoglycan/LPS O-acetylase OafA/YrhL
MPIFAPMIKERLRKFFRMEHKAEDRIFGLDLVRFIAIMMVVLGHGCIVLPDEVANVIKRFMLDGVSIFFVLSGFLIGGILIRQLEKGKDSWGDLVHFWKRRWMRTLPAYFFVLTIVMGYTMIVTPNLLPDRWWEFYFFVQNLFHPRPNFFGEAWSLSVEEWFYLTVPLLIFIGVILFRARPKIAILVVVIIVMAAAIVYRWFLYKSLFVYPGIEDFDAFRKHGDALITYRVLPRLDSLMFGVLGAYVMHYHPKVWKMKFRFLLFLLGGIVLYMIKRDNSEHYLMYDAVWLHVIKSVGVLLALPFLSTLVVRPNWFTRMVTFISLISYSMYLINLKGVLYMIMKNGIYQQYAGFWKLHPHWGFDYALFWTLTIGLSFLIYKFIETPFMNMRK